MATSGRKAQLQSLLVELEANIHDPLSEELVNQLVDGDFELGGVLSDAEFQAREAKQDEIAAINERGIRRPAAVENYRNALSTHRSTYKTMANRLPKLREQLSELAYRVRAHERMVEGNEYEGIWARWDQLSTEDKRWTVNAVSDLAERNRKNLPEVPDAVPWAAIFPADPHPKVAAQMVLLKKLIEQE